MEGAKWFANLGDRPKIVMLVSRESENSDRKQYGRQGEDDGVCGKTDTGSVAVSLNGIKSGTCAGYPGTC